MKKWYKLYKTHYPILDSPHYQLSRVSHRLDVPGRSVHASRKRIVADLSRYNRIAWVQETAWATSLPGLPRDLSAHRSSCGYHAFGKILHLYLLYRFQAVWPFNCHDYLYNIWPFTTVKICFFVKNVKISNAAIFMFTLIPVVDVIKLFLDEIRISPKLRNWKMVVLMSEPEQKYGNNAISNQNYTFKLLIAFKIAYSCCFC